MKRVLAILCLFTFVCSELRADYNPYNIKDIFSISVSSNMEIRKSEDSYTKFLQDTLCYFSNAEVVFQQKDLSQQDKSALEKYSRILILTDDDGNGEYPCSNEGDFSCDDLEELKSYAKQELAPDQDFIIPPSANVETNSNGCKFIRVFYERTGTKGPVCVNMCFFFNYNYATKVILSYRKSEKDIWKDDIEHTINSFNWKYPFTTASYTEDSIEKSEASNSNDFASGIIVGCVAMAFVFLVYIILSKTNTKKRREELESNINKAEKLIKANKLNSANTILTSTKERISSDDPDLQRKLAETQAKAKEKEHNIESLIQDNLDRADSSLSKGDVEKARSIVKETETLLSQELPQALCQKVKDKFNVIETEYESGIIPEQEIVYVDYTKPSDILSNKGFYFNSYFPQKGTVVFPYRRSKVERRGYTEEMFENKLRSSFASFTNYKVLGDVSILPNEGCHPYEPDIAIIENNAVKGIRIDIEIDEPYSGFDKKPIHYIGCGDEFRDINLVNMGWIVIRFSEKQIFCEPQRCISLIKHIISCIDSSVIPSEYSAPTPDKHWSLVEAQMMSVRKYREKMLNHKFGRLETSAITKQAITQTEIEKQAAKQVSPLTFNSKSYNNIDKSNTKFAQDNLISFEPNEHVYVYDGSIEMTPVSTIISQFFEPFDSIGMSERYAMKYGYDQCEVMEEWDSKGKESREIGTYLHAQIESYLNGIPVNDKTRYVYEGEFVNEDKMVSISRELEYFKSFLQDNPICPFRTEWHIFDLEHKIAGTIDLLCRNGSSFDMYDWKRSRKACPDEKVWRYSINGMSHIPDISFYHYALQQNIYKYILESNYGIVVGNMYIVVLHPEFGSYRKFQIPDMKKEVNLILRHIKFNH